MYFFVKTIFLIIRLVHRYTVGTDFRNCTRTREHLTRYGYRYEPVP
jgi:hypothetical protein